MKRILFLAVIIFVLTAILPAKNIIGKVTEIKGGDTIVVTARGKIKHTVRLLGIITPGAAQPFGPEAIKETTLLCLGKVVRVEVIKKESNGRIIGRVFTEDGAYVNEQLIATGYAWYYKKHGVIKRFPLLEETARDGKLGLWSEQNPVPPWEYK